MTHDPEIGKRADEMLRLRDGRIEAKRSGFDPEKEETRSTAEEKADAEGWFS